MDFNKSLLLIVSLSSLLLSGYAVPLTRSLSISDSPSSAPAPAPNSISLLSTFFTEATHAAEQVTKPEPKTLFTEAVHAAQHVFKPEPAILKFCTGTENPALCAETIAPYLHGSFDPIKALETEIEATLNQAKKVADIIVKSLGDAATSKNALDALDICKTQYESIVDTINEAVELLNQQNIVDAYYKFNSVLADRSACEDAFLESPGVDIPFADDSFAVSQLGGNCLAIMDGLVNHQSQF